MLDLPAEISGCSPIINQKIISTTFFNDVVYSVNNAHAKDGASFVAEMVSNFLL